MISATAIKPQNSLVVPRVMMIEDDQVSGQAVCVVLEKAGMQVCWVTTGAEAVTQKESFRPEIVLVDLQLPDVSGVELIRWLVDAKDCGVIVVSGAGDETDRIVGLELGADDYINKPPVMRELVARIRAVHRRTMQLTQEPEAPQQELATVGGITIDYLRRIVSGPDGKRIALTAAEYATIEALARAQGQVMSRDDISRAALRRQWRPDDRSVDQLVSALRQKLAPCANGHDLIESIRGSGYLLRFAP